MIFILTVTISTEGERLENTPKTFIGLFAGENLGKQLVKVG